MPDPEGPFRPVRGSDGYLPLEDLGLIGNGRTAALVGLDGSIPWLCLPRFDSEPLFCGLLDHARGGHFSVAPHDVIDARQRYETDTGILTTELRSPTGTVRLTDALVLRSGADLTDDVPQDRGELVRSAVVVDGEVDLRVEVEPRGGAQARALFSGLEIQASLRRDLRLHLRCNRPLESLRSRHVLRQGERLDLVLSWDRFHRHHRFDAEAMLRATGDAWRRWMAGFSYNGPQDALVRRAAITLKLCDDWTNGSLVAAPTSSLPAPVGGVRNWDYRYTWIRDASYSVFAMRRVGFGDEADAFLGWVLDAFENSRQPKIMYSLDGRSVPDEVEDAELEGYRRSAPVRWGNGAADQRQHDVYGEVMDCADQWLRAGGRLEPSLWAGLRHLAERADTAWRSPTRASGRSAARAACSPTRRPCARWPSTGLPRSVSGSARSRTQPAGARRRRSCASGSWRTRGTSAPRPSPSTSTGAAAWTPACSRFRGAG